MKLSKERREQILPLLDARGGLNPETVKEVHAQTRVPEAEIWGAASFYTLLEDHKPGIHVCESLTCQMAGADQWAKALEAEGQRVTRVSCLGQCDRAPAACERESHGLLKVVPYGGQPQKHATYPDRPDLPINIGGKDTPTYEALDIVRNNGSDWAIAQLKESGLQGRGGAGFSAAIKWDMVRHQNDTERYVVCNADEGEPGTFKDREIMRYRPHLLLEGLVIAAEVVKAQEIIIYIRGEFVEERASLEMAITDIEDRVRPLTLRLVSGHGAYICGEETALLESLEGRRGMPRLQPPYPTEKGFRQKPTLINNVETLACVPLIMKRGGAWFNDLGKTEPGTKLYCLSGDIKTPGVYELPLGVTLHELVDAAGGYIGTPKAFSPGGASAGFLPMTYGDTPLDFGHLQKVGSMLGSAGVVVLNDTADMVEAAKIQANFFEDESCGQCAPCRIGTRIVNRAIASFQKSNNGAALAHMDDVIWEMEEGSICGLGMVAGKPLESAMKYFPEDFTKASAVPMETKS